MPHIVELKAGNCQDWAVGRERHLISVQPTCKLDAAAESQLPEATVFCRLGIVVIQSNELHTLGDFACLI
jgi:hypothetical protein